MTHRSIIVWIFKLEYQVFLEKRALKHNTFFGNPGIPDSKTRLVAKMDIIADLWIQPLSLKPFIYGAFMRKYHFNYIINKLYEQINTVCMLGYMI